MKNGFPMENTALDCGYDTSPVYRGLELLSISGSNPAIQFSNSPEKYVFSYLPQEVAFSYSAGIRLVCRRLNCSQTTEKHLRCNQVQYDSCGTCKRPSDCFEQTGIQRSILGSNCCPGFYGGDKRIGSDTHWNGMCLRKIWAEGLFAVLIWERCLSKVKKRGIQL